MPTQLALHFWPTWSYVYGLRSDILAPAVYLTDILVILLIFLNWKVLLEIQKRHLPFTLFLYFFLVINITLSISPAESFYKALKILEMTSIIVIFAKNKYIKSPQIAKILFISLVLFSLIGIGQFIKGRTLGGILYYLGERAFTLNTPGIALVTLEGINHMRAYSTFSHPNSLAGFLGVFIVFYLISGYFKSRWPIIFGLLPIASCFVLTFSLSSYISFAISVIFGVLIKKCNLQKLVNFFLILFTLFSLIMPLVGYFIIFSDLIIQRNIYERLYFAVVAGKVLLKNPLFGSGLGTFIYSIPNYSASITNQWIFQPVHNVFLLVLSEMGIVGLLFFVFGIYKYTKTLIEEKKYNFLVAFIFVLITGLADHYWLSLQQNNLVLSLLIGLSLR